MPVLFAPPELQSNNDWFWHGGLAFSPDGTEFYMDVYYPNANPSGMRVRLPEQTVLSISFMNQSGQPEYFPVTTKTYAAGEHSICIPTGNLLPGIHFYVIKTGAHWPLVGKISVMKIEHACDRGSGQNVISYFSHIVPINHSFCRFRACLPRCYSRIYRGSRQKLRQWLSKSRMNLHNPSRRNCQNCGSRRPAL